MNARRFLPFASLLLLVACGGATSSSDPNEPPKPGDGVEEPASGTVTVPNVGEVSGVRVTDHRTADAPKVAAFRDPTKMTEAIEKLGLSGTLTETTSLPNCISSVGVELFDAAGKVTATADVYCSSNEVILRAGEKAWRAPLVDLDGVTKLEGDRTLVANWLFDVSKVEIDQPLEDRHKVLEKRAEIDEAIGALSALETFDPNAPRTRCAADYAVTFTRLVGEGEPVKTHLYISCGGDPKPSQPGWFQATDTLDGRITVNAQLIAKLAN